MPVYLNPTSSFANSTGSVTPFVRRIEDYPLSDGLKMPSHIGSYDGKGDPDNFLHLFEGAIRMQNWLMPVACHMFTCTLKDSARIYFGSTRRAAYLWFCSWFKDKKLSRAYLHRPPIHLQRFDGKNPTPRSKQEKWQPMELLMIEEIFLKDQENPLRTITEDRKAGIDYGHDTNDCRQLRNQIEEAVRLGQLSHLVKGIKKERVKAFENQRKERKKDKITMPVEAPILVIRQDESNSPAPVVIKAKIFGREVNQVHMDGGSSCEEKNLVLLGNSFGNHDRRPPLTRKETLNFVIVKYDSPYNMLLGRTTMQKMGIMVSTIHGAIKFHTNEGIGTVFLTYESDKVKKGVKKIRETPPASEKGVFSCTTAEEKVVINNKYLEQAVIIEKQLLEHFKDRLRDLLRANADVFAWTHADMTGIPRTITVKVNPFNTKHKLNEYSHVKLVKQKRRGMGPDRSTSAYKEVEELTMAGILPKVKHQKWVASPVMVKKSNEGWRMCVDFTDINKACLKDCYPLPEINWKVESLSGFRLKCFLDAYKGYHQIQMAEEDEDKTAFFTGEGSLNEKIAALSCFLSKGVKRSLPFFNVLKSCTDKKNIQWTQEAEAALQEMKKFVEILPTLTAPVQGEVLMMYLTASTKSISATLFAKMEEEQVPIYFVSRVLQGLELNYPGMEKLILALVHATRRLRRGDETPKDFLIEVPLDDNKMKAQEKADTKPMKTELNHEGKEYTYALRFEFKTTNNKAEYEALLAGLRISQEMEITSLAIFVDSQLLVNQHKGSAGRSPTKAVNRRERDPIEDPKESRKIRVKAPQYKLIRGNLYRRPFYTPWIRCMASPQTDDTVKEVHEGYYWPSMHRDAAKVLQDCEKCKEQSAIRKVAESSSITARSGWPFSHWGVNILGPLLTALRDLCKGLKVTQSFSPITKHMEIMNHIEKQLARSQQGWVDDLAQVLWVHRRLPRNSQKETLFSLTYGFEAIIPIFENDVAKDDRGRIKEVDKRRGSKEIASIEEA
ncbi:reverse transcriptase domain-containing protein [Tanacetum coccineum]